MKRRKRGLMIDHTQHHPTSSLTLLYEVRCCGGGVEEIGAHASQLSQEAASGDVEGIPEASGSGLLVLESGAYGQADPVTQVNTERIETKVNT